MIELKLARELLEGLDLADLKSLATKTHERSSRRGGVSRDDLLQTLSTKKLIFDAKALKKEWTGDLGDAEKVIRRLLAAGQLTLDDLSGEHHRSESPLTPPPPEQEFCGTVTALLSYLLASESAFVVVHAPDEPVNIGLHATQLAELIENSLDKDEIVGEDLLQVDTWWFKVNAKQEVNWRVEPGVQVSHLPVYSLSILLCRNPLVHGASFQLGSTLPPPVNKGKKKGRSYPRGDLPPNAAHRNKHLNAHAYIKEHWINDPNFERIRNADPVGFTVEALVELADWMRNVHNNVKANSSSKNVALTVYESKHLVG
ncbi:hypothetical protein AAF712_015859 [Marasmius tenuissimus]|uniref:Uncharacterized protein n=1 Tax=Marasmius tenuissimus TaxID=585030 RepID=A0ABR2Z748_9AGAR